MTKKRNLLLLSLLFVFGLSVAAPLFAVPVVVFNGNTPTVRIIRNEGDAEAVGTITLTTSNGGTIYNLSTATFVFSSTIGSNLIGWSTQVVCTGNLAGANCPVGNVGPSNTVKLTFPTVVVAPGDTVSLTVRVMAQGLAYGQTVTSGVTVLSSQSATNQISVSPPSYTVAQVASGPALTVALKGDAAQVLTCIGVKKIDTYNKDFAIRITENWSGALTSLTDEWGLENDTSSGGPFNGSGVLVTFAAIPMGLHIEAGDVYYCWQYPSGPHGCISESSNLTLGAETHTSTVSGVKSFFYPVTDTSLRLGSPEAQGVVLHFHVWSEGPLMPNMSLAVTETVSLSDSLTPATTAPPPVGTGNAIPYFSMAEPGSLTVVELSDCVTNMLFPYINTYQGSGIAPFSHFGTGIDFANTTTDPFGLNPATAKGSAVPQHGFCTVYFYGADESGPYIYVTPDISTGGSYAFDVASAVGTTPIVSVNPTYFAARTGYAIAICGFQNAYGFAEIYDNFGPAPIGFNNPTATMGYLAYIIADPTFYHRSPGGDALGENAIVPYNLNKHLIKDLMYGTSCCD